MAKKITYSLNSVAAQVKVSPKAVRAKIRRTAKADLPFDYNKVDTSNLTAKQAKDLVALMQTDNRVRD